MSTDSGPFVVIDQWSINTDQCYPMLRIVALSNGDLALHTIGESLDQGFCWSKADSREFADALTARIAFCRDVARADEVHRSIVAREGRQLGWPYFSGNSSKAEGTIHKATKSKRKARL